MQRCSLSRRVSPGYVGRLDLREGMGNDKIDHIAALNSPSP